MKSGVEWGGVGVWVGSSGSNVCFYLAFLQTKVSLPITFLVSLRFL